MSGGVDWGLDGVEASWCAARIGGGLSIGHRADVLVTPASVMKVQVALAVGAATDDGRLDSARRIRLDPGKRTPGPVGMSLMSDAVEMSLRDLLIPMLTISDNVATDALIATVGLEAVNAVATRLDLTRTAVANDLGSMLDGMAEEAGFTDYASMLGHDPARDGPPIEDEVRARLAASSAFDPRRGSRTTPADMVRLLSLIWADAAGTPEFCARLRRLMGQQLTRNRIASGFDSSFTVAAKSGGLMGVVRNEIGVVTDQNERSYALAIFTRKSLGSSAAPTAIDNEIGVLARQLVSQLQASAE